MPIYDSERGMLTPDEPSSDTDPGTPAGGGRVIHQQDDPQLFERIESLMSEGATEMELEGKVYNIARDKDDRGETYVLTPKN